MSKPDYAEQRLDPRWQQKRLIVMQRDKFTCQHCSSTTKTLNVHHSYYVTGRMVWEYPDWSLTTLCRDCHKDEHDNHPYSEFNIIEDNVGLALGADNLFDPLRSFLQAFQAKCHREGRDVGVELQALAEYFDIGEAPSGG